MSDHPVSAYCLVIESDPTDNTSDLIGVRRTGGSMFGPPKKTCVDRIARAGNSRGNVVQTAVYDGWPPLRDLDLLRDHVAEWTAPYGDPPDLRAL